jgi:DNA primase
MLNINNTLLDLLNRVLGEEGKYTSNGNYSYHCPICNHHKRKLEINLETNEKGENPWHCWTCLETKGKTVKSLFKKLEVAPDKNNELKLILRPGTKKQQAPEEQIKLPEEYISLVDISNLNKVVQLEARRAIQYLKKRHITKDDILKYHIGFCEEGKYSGRIIIPSYDAKCKLNYFVARSFKEDVFSKYKNPPISSKIIGLELFINWDAPIILVEGIFDALTIKRNVIPLFGKIINNALMEKLAESSVDKIYICLDPDAIKSSINYAEKLMNMGKEVYLVEIDGKDINEIGYSRFLNILEKTQPLNFSKIMQLKLNLI